MCYTSYVLSFVSLPPVGVKYPTPRTPTVPTAPTLSLNFLFFLFFGGVTRSGLSLFIIFIIISTILQKSSICPFICVLPHFYFLFV